MAKNKATVETAESLAQKQRDISVSEFFLKNRHLLGFDSPRKALLTCVKEAVDNSLDACEEGGILPEIGVDIRQIADDRFRVSVTDNGPGIVKAQIPKIFAKLLYGSKFHRLRMSRGQQGIGISAAGMYGQLTTGSSTKILSKIKSSKMAHKMNVQIDTRANKPIVLAEEDIEWLPVFVPVVEGKTGNPIEYKHGTCVTINLEAAYVRGRLSVDEYVKQCAIVNPHLQLHFGLTLLPKPETGNLKPEEKQKAKNTESSSNTPVSDLRSQVSYFRAINQLPQPPSEIKPHPHGVELGILMQMLKDSRARALRSALSTDFSRVSHRTALEICERAKLNPKANPTRIAHQESESLYKAIQDTKLMRPPTDCLSPIGEPAIIAGLKKEIAADFYTAVTRDPEVYRGNPFQIEVGIAYAKPDPTQEIGAEEPVRVMRFANRVPLLYQSGACAVTRAIAGVNWKAYGLSQPKDAVPLGPMVVLVHMASVWVPFTSESKEAIAHYQEIIKEITYALQECGRQLSMYLRRRRRDQEAQRKRNYIEMYLPHLALGLKEILDLDDQQKKSIIDKLEKMLEKTHLDV